MKFPSFFKSSRSLKIGALLLLNASCGLACGPDFPNRYLDLPAHVILAAPEGFFAVEIQRLIPTAKIFMASEELEKDTREVDDLRAALVKRGDRSDCVAQILQAYECYRTRQRRSAEDKNAPKPGPLPAGLPAEFTHYLKGAEAWYENDLSAAAAEWRNILALPAAERHYRSTWAAYMLGRTVEDDFSPTKSREWFVEVRELAKAGFADSINLAGATYGVEAHCALEQQDYAEAIRLYLEQYGTGDQSAYLSLRIAAAAAAKSDDRKKGELALDPKARRVITAWFLARFNSSYDVEPDLVPLRAWTTALACAKIQDVDHADRLAWLAYEAGEFELAKTWAGFALDSSPETHWLRGKLALRDNRLCDGAEELGRAAASPALAAVYRSTILGELGRVQLALDRREAALATWLDGAHWEDAAYVAERLLTIDELKTFQANYCPVRLPLYEPYAGEVVNLRTLISPQSGRGYPGDDSRGSLQQQLAELLARRLVRAGRVQEAKPYFCAKNQVALTAYVTEVEAGFNVRLAAGKRAKAFWRAAQLVREEGMVLMGAELEPDFAVWGGSFHNFDIAGDRLKLNVGPFATTKEESDRLASIAVPAKRFSYRYRAADLAWWAASLLPNDNDETATILNTAGGWLKARDPVEANRFYQALVIRCGRTKLGKAAAARHWFPLEG